MAEVGGADSGGVEHGAVTASVTHDDDIVGDLADLVFFAGERSLNDQRGWSVVTAVTVIQVPSAGWR